MHVGIASPSHTLTFCYLHQRPPLHSPLAEGVRRAVGADRHQVLGLLHHDVKSAPRSARPPAAAALLWRRVLQSHDDVTAPRAALLVQVALSEEEGGGGVIVWFK